MSSPVRARRGLRSSGHVKSREKEEQFKERDISGDELQATHTASEDEIDANRKNEKRQSKLQKRSPSKKQNKIVKVSDDEEEEEELDSGIIKPVQKHLKRRSPQQATSRCTSYDNGSHAKNGTNEGIISVHILCLTCVTVLVVAVVLLFGSSVKGKPVVREMERQEKFESKLDELKSKFPKQNERFWNVVAAAPMSHLLEYGEVNRPVVILLAGQPGAESTTMYIANEIAEIYTVGLIGSLSGIVSINGSKYMGAESDYTKKDIDSDLRNGFDGFSKAAIVHRFDQLPACTALLFHSYCENDNAPYKNVAIILTVSLDQSVAMDNIKEIERQVNDHLGKSWSRCPDFQERGKVEAMLSRVANNIALVSEEKLQ